MARQRDGRPAGKEEQPHRWAIDRIEEGTAAVEQDGDHVYEIPRYLVPTDATDGDVLTVSVAPGGPGEVTISVRIDRTASRPAAPDRPSRAKKSDSDRGGDIVL